MGPQLQRLGARVEAEHRDGAAGRLEQAEDDLDESALAGAVGADKADDARLEIDRERIEGGDAGISLGQLAGADQGHEDRKGVGTSGREPRRANRENY